jgi:transcriptional regulator with XRE-family HTH domain
MLDKYAEELREARDKKGITLQQMAAKTRIDIKFLEAIDNGNFSFLPELYVKAFLKQYAKVVGLDEKETIERYEDAKDGKLIVKEEGKSLLEQKVDIEKEKKIEKETVKKVAKETVKEPEVKAKEPQLKTFSDVSSKNAPDDSGKRYKKLIRTALTTAAVATVMLILYFLFFSESSDIIVEEKPYDQVLQETKERFKVEKREEPLQTATEISDSLLVQITNVDSVDSVWVLVIYDDKSKEDFMLYPRSGKSVKAANNFKFTFGNSGVVSLKLNNSVLNFEGRRRSVRHFKVDSSGIERLFSPPILKIE